MIKLNKIKIIKITNKLSYNYKKIHNKHFKFLKKVKIQLKIIVIILF